MDSRYKKLLADAARIEMDMQNRAKESNDDGLTPNRFGMYYDSKTLNTLIEILRVAREMADDNGYASLCLGNAYLDSCQYDQAIEALASTAHGGGPYSAAAYLSLAMVYVELREAATAEEHLKAHNELVRREGKEFLVRPIEAVDPDNKRSLK